VRKADRLIADALRDIAAEARPPRPMVDAAWRAGRRRRLAVLAASAASIAGAIVLALALLLPLSAAPGPVSGPTAPSPLVSITLAPTTPASTEALARAAQLLGQRAASLHLPDTHAQVSGPDVVLTGPAADQAQLKAIVIAGLLNFRQVLLFQPYGRPASASGRAYGDTSLVNHRTRALFRKLACKPGNTMAWEAQVGYRTPESYDNPDTQVVSCDSRGDKYALDVAKVPGTQIRSAVASSGPGGQWFVLLTLKSAGTAAFGTLTSELYSKYYAAGGNNDATNDYWLDTIAVVLDGNVITAPEIEGPIPFGTVQIYGYAVTRASAEELAADVRSGALPVDFRVSAISTFTPPASSRAAG
jgi:hypothetical protein